MKCYPRGTTNCPECGGEAEWFLDDFGTSLMCSACDMAAHMRFLDETNRVLTAYNNAVTAAKKVKDAAIVRINDAHMSESIRRHTVSVHYREILPYIPPPSPKGMIGRFG